MAWSKPDLKERIKTAIKNNNRAAINKELGALQARDYWQALDDAIKDNPFDASVLRSIVFVNNKVPQGAVNSIGLTRLDVLSKGKVFAEKQGKNNQANEIHQIFKDLLVLGPEELFFMVNKIDANGFTPLHSAVFYGDIESARSLLEVPGAYEKANRSINLLEMARKTNDKSMIALLASYGVTANDRRSSRSDTLKTVKPGPVVNTNQTQTKKFPVRRQKRT